MTRRALMVSSSGSPGPTPTPKRWPAGPVAGGVRHVTAPSAGEGVERGHRHGAAAAPAVDGEVRDAVVEGGQGLLRLGGADEPDRQAEDGGRPGGTVEHQLEQPEQRRRGVADDRHRAVEIGEPAVDRGGRPGRCPPPRASSAMPGSWRVHRTSLPAGRRARVMPLATIIESQKIGRPASSAPRAAVTRSGDAATSGTMSTSPQAWIMRTTTGSRSAGTPERSASDRMVANDAVVDRGAVALVVEAPHGRAPAVDEPARRVGDEVGDAGRQRRTASRSRTGAGVPPTSPARTSRSAATSVSARPCSHPREPTQADTSERGSPGRVISARSARADSRASTSRPQDAAERQ